MKSYSEIVNKHFKVNKRRNIATIVGVTVSIILFIVVGYISKYMSEINVAEAINERGNYEAIFMDVNTNDIDKVIHNVNVESYGFYYLEYEKDISTGIVNKSFEIYSLDQNAINNIFNPLLRLKEGTLPTKLGELALTYSAKEFLGKNIGDKIEFDNKVYNITGFYEDDIDRIGTKLSGITFLEPSDIKNNVSLSINIKSKKNKVEEIKNITKVLNLENTKKVLFNSRLFYAYGIEISDYGTRYGNERTDASIVIINIVILLLTILFTYGSINVSLKERIRDFAALRCIGATPNKIRYLLIKESFILGILTIVPGIVLGQILSWLISGVVFAKIIGINNYGIGLKVYPIIILATVVFTALTITLATIIPIIKASKITPIQGVKSEIKAKVKVKRRNSKLINKIFGYKGNLAYKNIANNKSFILITSSLTVLLVIFTTFSWYYSFLLNEYNRDKKNGFDIAATYDPYRIAEKEEIEVQEVLTITNDLEENIRSLGVVKEMFNNFSIRMKMSINGMGVNPKLSITNPVYSDLYVQMNSIEASGANLLVYDDASINRILPYINSSHKNKEVTLQQFNDNGFIILNTAYGQKVTPLVPIENQNIELYLGEQNNNPISANYLGSIEHDNLISANRFGYYNDLTIIVSNSFISKNSELINQVNPFSSTVKINMNITDNADKLKVKSEVERLISLGGGSFLNELENLQEYKKSYDALAVLIYTTLVLAMIIGAINIINTRSVDIMIRKKEFGTMLAVGMSNQNLKKLIILEGIVQWFISATLGTILSIIIVKILNFIFIFSEDAVMYANPYGAILLGAVVLLIINLLSSLLPYKKFNKVEVTELLRNED